jgi:DNA (cytosine-5)-methyltransferase 1
MLKIGSLCTGYGGLDMAVEAFFDAETVWTSDIDKYASKVIAERIKKPNLGDLKQIDWTQVEPIDILTAGYPCQPFSHAGQRKGTNDERHIFPKIMEAISVLRPSIIVLENVRGHLSLGFDEVLKGLAQNGYDAKWRIVRASDAGAPHQRARLFIVAYPANCGRTHRNAVRSEEAQPESSHNGRSTDSNCDPCTKSRRAFEMLQRACRAIKDKTNWNEYRFSLEMDRQEIPDTLDEGRLNPRFVEYMMGLPNGWVTDVGLTRTHQLKMLGNGVVPQQAFLALKLLGSDEIVDN